VLAENYLQHAEHYTRIIMAYRDQLQQPGDMPNGNGLRLREPGDSDEFGGDDDGGDDMLDDGFAPQHQPPPRSSIRRRAIPEATTPTVIPTATIGPSGATSSAVTASVTAVTGIAR